MNSKTRTILSAFVLLLIIMLAGQMVGEKTVLVATNTPESHGELKMPGTQMPDTQKDITLDQSGSDQIVVSTTLPDLRFHQNPGVSVVTVVTIPQSQGKLK